MYYEEVTGYEEDGLIGHAAIAPIMHNIKVSKAVTRGHLICKGTSGTWSPVTENDDAEKVLAIAAADFTPSTGNDVTQAYMSGVFCLEKIYIGDTAPYVSLGHLDKVETLIGEEFELETFTEALRVQNIYLTKGVVA